MPTRYKLLIGFANGDLHYIQVMGVLDPWVMATAETERVGQPTNAGFRTIVAVVGMRDEGETAVIEYAAEWNGDRVNVTIPRASRTASSYELYAWCSEANDQVLEAWRLQDFCRDLRMEQG